MTAFGVFQQVFKDFTKLDGFSKRMFLKNAHNVIETGKKHDNGEKRISLKSLITTIEIYEHT